LAASTIGLWIVTLRSGKRQTEDMKAAIEASNLQAKASERQADIAERSLDSINRAWIDLDVTLKEGDDILALTEKEIRADITIIIKNHGRSPALKTSLTIDLSPTFDQAYDFLQAAKKVASSPIHLAARHGDVNMIGPDKIHEAPYIITVPMPKQNELPSDTDDGIVGIFIVVCASYGLGTSNRPRYTGMIFEIIHGYGPPITFKTSDMGIFHSGRLAVRPVGVGDAI
jgi:hypothetical protein